MYVLAIDQGTTGTTTVLYEESGAPVAKAYREFRQIYPKPGWVEHDPLEIWKTVQETVAEICTPERAKRIAALGITNQRETTVMWDKKTGTPVHNAIVWQCRRTADQCARLKQHEPFIRERTGLPVDAYFSGTKIQWILDAIGGYQEGLLFGTIDTWLVWKLTGGKTHATDFTNASRTMLFNIHAKKWDQELCDLMNIFPALLPQVKKSIDDYGIVESLPQIRGAPVFGVAGDQQAALFGQTCFEKGSIKNTYGTGCFAVMNTGDVPVHSTKGLITTLAVNGKGNPCYALEGSIFIAGAAIQWLRDELKLLNTASESEAAARAVENTNGVYLVPAFVGLGAPHWNMEARGILAGLTRGANRNHIIRAALESMAYQTLDVLEAMERETAIAVKSLAVDGGASANDFLMQFQADILGKSVVRPTVIESTSLGAAYLAGLKAGVWKTHEALFAHKSIDRVFVPAMKNRTRAALVSGWRRALRQAVTV